jgi:hypothetical protein
MTVTTTLVAKAYIKIMKIIRFYKEKLRWDLEKLYALQQKGKDTLKENSVQLFVTVGMWKYSGKIVRMCVTFYE